VPGKLEPGFDDDSDHLARVLEDRVATEAVLYPCGDAATVSVAALPPAFRERFRSFLPAPEVLEEVVDKDRLARLARNAGVPHPRTVLIEDEERLRSLDEAHLRSALLKPVDSQRFFRKFGVKSVPVEGRDEAIDAYRRFGSGEFEVLLQEYVPGPASAHLFVDGYRTPDGRTPGLLVRRRERMYPPAVGNSSSTVTVHPSEGEDAVTHLDSLLKAAGFYGIFSAEFKRDPRDGVARLLEVNVRPWWYVEFASRCGVDVCAMAYSDALDRPVERSTSYAVGRRCIYTYYDLFAARSQLRTDRLSLVRWLRSWAGADHPIFSWDDPCPAVLTGWKRLRGAVGRRLRPFRPGSAPTSTDRPA
jgi:predicted ATP-grasp superfamily ATP-dependent carboligase